VVAHAFSREPPVRRPVQRRLKGDPNGTGDAPPAEPKSVDEWAVSSFELKYGLDVEDVGDTVPAALLDTLFNEPRS
jgi:hypothetical protein